MIIVEEMEVMSDLTLRDMTEGEDCCRLGRGCSADLLPVRQNGGALVQGHDNHARNVAVAASRRRPPRGHRMKIEVKQTDTTWLCSCHRKECERKRLLVEVQYDDGSLFRMAVVGVPLLPEEMQR